MPAPQEVAQMNGAAAVFALRVHHCVEADEAVALESLLSHA